MDEFFLVDPIILNGLVHAFYHSVVVFLGCDQYVDDNQGWAIHS